MFDMSSVQLMLHSLIERFANIDSQAIVAEKSEDGAAIKMAGVAIARVGASIEATTADGIVSADEFAKIKADIAAAKDAFSALGVEIMDQQTNTAGPRTDDDPDPTVS